MEVFELISESLRATKKSQRKPLTHFSLASYKGTLVNSVDPDQTPQNAASDQGQHCLHYSDNSLKYDNDTKQPDTADIRNGPVQRVMVEESNRHKWAYGAKIKTTERTC